MSPTISNVDVLVIGLGPGGGSAAAIAAAQGLNVIAVEKKQQVGVPVQCAEFIPLPMSRYAVDENVRVQQIAGMNSFLPSGDAAHTDFPGLMIERDSFDQAIAGGARLAGAELLTGTRLLRLDTETKQAVVIFGNEEQCINYRVLIAADGPHSTVAKLMGLPPLQTVYTRQYTVPLLHDYSDTDVWLSDDFPGGYAWLFPKGDVANLGLGIDHRFTKDLKTPLDNLLQQLHEQGLVGDTILSRTGGEIPVGGLREQLYVKDVLFVGDAAGLTHPITGAGISTAVISGERAGQAVVEYLAGDEDALQEFEEDIRDQYQQTIDRAVERRQMLNSIWHTPSARDDVAMRHGWIAFDEYFSYQPEPEKSALAV